MQYITIDWARIDDIFELFKMSERNVVSLRQLKYLKNTGKEKTGFDNLVILEFTTMQVV
jgi:hypothetical protein